MRKLLGPTLCKLLQRQTYTCLSSRYGIWLCIGGLLLTFISAFQFGEVVLEWSMQKYAVTFNAYHDNIAGKTFQDRLCLPIPIDVVYTWVNGSDPKLVAALKRLKDDLESGQNETRRDGRLRLKASNSSVKALFHSKTKAKGEATRGACPFANCVKSFSLIVQGLPDNTSLEKIHSLGKAFKKATKAFSLTSLGSIKEKVTVIQFSSDLETADALKGRVTWKGQSLNITEGFFTSDSTRPSAVRSDTEVMILDIKTSGDLDKLRKDLGERFGEKLLLNVRYHIAAQLAVAYFSEKSAAVSAANTKLSLRGTSLKMMPAMYIWTPFSAMKGWSSKGDEEDAGMSASRFADNQELKYSLRSIEKHAPWVRKIFIVTNGQLPSWLNLDNHRVEVITHAELFPNASHLPTFSSPAIESHLHRIPGLSQRFIYMNDDVMFGEDVWPDDFYTHSKGQKIFLTWSVPNCNEGCPSSWINDKYCDKACNVSVCDWDGGDCLGVKKHSAWNYQGWRAQSSFRLEFCSSGCADTWVGDRYCDVACNVATCGFDAGDCGTRDMSQLYSVDVDRSSELIFLPRGLKAMFFNLSSVFGQGKITTGDHSDSEVVRSATVAQKHKILTLTFRKNVSLSTIEFNIEGYTDKNGTMATKLKFNITVDTRPGKAEKPTVRQPDMRGTLHAESTATTSLPTNATKPPRTIYPVRVHHSETILNYWVLGNESVAKPTWMFDDGKYVIPETANNTAFPEHVKKALEATEQEFKDGDLTEKGLARRKAKILEEYLSRVNANAIVTPHTNDGHVVALTAPSDFRIWRPTQAATIAMKNPRQGEEIKNRHGGNSHTRKLLWTGVPDQTNGEPGSIPAVPEPPPTDDDIFVADWIANSKQKQLSLAKDQEDERRKWQERYGDWTPISNPAATSFLPWERLGIFDGVQKALEKQRRAAQYTTRGSHHHSRKLMDTFADSLLHVNKIYNRKFGYIARKVPAHMPHMIDVQIMNELQAIFPEEFDATSSHKLRSSEDMQFAFSYMYFVVGQKKALNVTEIFAELDTDHSGYLSDRELRSLATRLYKLPLDQRDLKALQETLNNCSNPETVRPQEEFLPMVSDAFLQQCEPILKMLNISSKDSRKYKYETVSDEDVAFHMIRDNATKVLQQLDAIRSKRKKFVCLNDNIDHSKEEAQLIKALLVDFYESLFPVPSQFELLKKYRNRFIYMSDVKTWLKERELARFWVNVFIGSVLVIAFLALFPSVTTWVVRTFCPFRRSQSVSYRLLTV